MESHLQSADNGNVGAELAADATVPGPVANTPHSVRLSSKRMLSEDTDDSPKFDVFDKPEEFDFPDAPPDGVHPNMWSMLQAINRKLARVNTIENI